jgi:hypothetical protein
VLELFEELRLLQLAVRARAKSRAASAGVFYVPHELDINGQDGSADDSAQAGNPSDPFMTLLIRTMQSAIKDPGSAAAVAPIIIRGPAEYADALRHIPLADPMETYPEEGLRAELIRRIAMGLDMPPEILLGMTDANHWSAWQIDDQTWTAHLQPVTQQMCDDFTSAYLRPAAREAGIPNWDEIVVGYDATDVINHPDRARDAKDLWDRGALSYETLRAVAGFSESDAPDEAEHDEWLAVKLGDPMMVSSDSVGQDNAADAVESAPETGSEGDVATEIVAAAELMVDRLRELAGSRLRTQVRGDSALSASIDGVPNNDVARVLDPSARDSARLVAGGSMAFEAFCARRGVQQAVAEKLAGVVSAHAARTLTSDDPGLPNGFREYVRSVL